VRLSSKDWYSQRREGRPVKKPEAIHLQEMHYTKKYKSGHPEKSQNPNI